MDISLVLAVFNNLDYTKNTYKRIRDIYPDAPMVISSGGSTDGTLDWLQSLDDDNLSYIHDDDQLTFSDNYNSAIKLVDTDKLVLIHNDMVIGKNFLENLSELIDEKSLITYTTIEPPIFKGHKRPGKVILELGRGFNDFNYHLFDQYVDKVKERKELVNGATFFMSGYKKTFIDVGLFDGFTFDPFFCEDDDFIIRAKLKGYLLKTTECAVVYHFVSKTSRVLRSEESKLSEHRNIRNFIRKWGITIPTFNELYYWEDEIFNYPTFNMGIELRSDRHLYKLEPYFDKLYLGGTTPTEYIANEQPNTNYDLRSKFLLTDMVDVTIIETEPMNEEDLHVINKIRLSIPHYDVGEYQIGNLKIVIKKKV